VKSGRDRLHERAVISHPTMTTPRRPLIAGNWKMNGSVASAVTLVDALHMAVGGLTDRDVLVAPPFPYLGLVAERLRGTRILLGAQNLHWEDHGAFTGEVSAPMLRDVGCSHVIIGHSERRQLCGETDAAVARKARAALRHDLTPIVCVGETLEQREAGKTLAVVHAQVRGGVLDLAPDQLPRLVIAYEPVWAIGTGRVATPDQAEEVHAAIRALVAQAAGPAIAAGLRILYGGSVKPDNIDALMRQGDIDGALVGGASLSAADFGRIARFAR
jgi:triosephosphate isomerase